MVISVTIYMHKHIFAFHQLYYLFSQRLAIQPNHLIRQYFPDLYKRKCVEGEETN